MPDEKETSSDSGAQEAAANEEEPTAADAPQQQAPSLNFNNNMFANMNLMDNDDSSSDGDSENPMSSLPPSVLQRVEKLKQLHEKRDEIMEQYLVDRAALEAKYQGLCKPLFDERAEIVKGMHDSKIKEEFKVEGNQETTKAQSKQGQVETVDDKEDEEEPVTDNDTENEIDVVGIPQFWVCAMSHMEPLAELITEEDVDCLENLVDVTCVDDADGTSFTLEFHFAPNDYFSNTVLTKRYEVPNLLLDDEPILKNVEGCKIDWKSPEKTLTVREITKKQRGTGKNAGKVRTVKKKERRESFFHFFTPPKMPSLETMDEDEADRLEEAFEQDYDVAQAFRSHIIPKAVLWFTGQALEDEMEQMMGEAAAEFVAGGDGGAVSSNPFPPPVEGERPPECDQQN